MIINNYNLIFNEEKLPTLLKEATIDAPEILTMELKLFQHMNCLRILTEVILDGLIHRKIEKLLKIIVAKTTIIVMEIHYDKTDILTE